MYGSETWTLRRTDERRSEAAERSSYDMQQGQGEKLRNEVTVRTEEVVQTNTRNEERLTATSVEEDFGNSPQANFILSA
jgi:hypothetical protein